MKWGGRSRGALTALCCALLLGACNEEESTETVPPPELKAEWSIPGLNALPERTGTRHWITQPSFRSGVSWATTWSYGPLQMYDARTGEIHTRGLSGGAVCLFPQLLSDNGVVPVLHDAGNDPGCDGITVLDADTGTTLWSEDTLDLDALSEERALGADDRAVALVDHQGRTVCFEARGGKPLEDDDASCLALHDRFTHADLPDLLDDDGRPAPLSSRLERNVGPAEIGRTDEVLLVRAFDERNSDAPLVRAHDLETGETLWQDDDLIPDPHDGDAWSRDETYFVAPSGIARVSYEHPDDEESAHLTPMVLTAVDPRTGKDLRPVARVEGAWFNHQFEDMTVALTEQDLLFRSTISGFELPTW